MNFSKILLALPAALLLQACSDSSDFDFQPGIDQQAADVIASADSQALFDPSATPPAIPFPSTLVFNGSDDGTINIPVNDPTDLQDPQVGINQLDGLSTLSPISTPLNRDVNPDTVAVGTSVVVVEVQANISTGFATSGVISPLGPDAITAFASPGNLVIQPLQPLQPSSTYLVLLTDALEDTTGAPLERSFTYTLLAGETPLVDPTTSALQQIIQSHLAVADGVGVPRDTVVLSFTFNTQSIRETLAAVQNVSTPQPLIVAETGLTTETINEAAPGSGSADIWIGTLDVPYYQTAIGANGAADVLDSFWTGAGGSLLTATNPLPVTTNNGNANGTETIPVLVSVPNASATLGGNMPIAGWPVVIFQHGITQNRTNLLAVADTLANVGFAAIAIDMPLHGITESSMLNASETGFPNDRERTFDIDVVNNDNPLDIGPDGEVDPSGTHFYQLTNLPNSRDNLRQSVADLFVLSNSLSGVQSTDPAGSPIRFDISQKAFVGHSLGAIVGSVFLSYDTTIRSGTLANPGSGIAQLLAGSVNFGPTINAGLTAAGAPPGSPEFAQFLLAAQTVIDSGDPANHMSFLANTGTPIHMIEVIGDETVPNAVPNAPFSGTEPMAALLGLPAVTASTNGSGLVRFSTGTHSSFLNPEPNPAVTVEMQTQMATFATTNGVVLPIINTTLIDSSGAAP